MKTRRTFVSLTAILLACTAFFWLATSSGVEKKLEVQTYNLPEYRSDTARAIDAYQQMINRLLDDNERSRGVLQEQMNTVITKLDKIQADLDALSLRIARIEKKMGIEEAPPENKPAPGPLNQPEIPQTPQQPESPPSS
jgi:hypothetical protein